MSRRRSSEARARGQKSAWATIIASKKAGSGDPMSWKLAFEGLLSEDKLKEKVERLRRQYAHVRAFRGRTLVQESRVAVTTPRKGARPSDDTSAELSRDQAATPDRRKAPRLVVPPPRLERQGPELRPAARVASETNNPAPSLSPKWLPKKCTGCSSAIFICREWNNPSLLCRDCFDRRRRKRFGLNITKLLGQLSKPRPWRGGHLVQGGLPSLGRRR